MGSSPEKEALSLEVIESQSLRELPPRLLPSLIIVPFSDLIGAISFVLCSCLFLTGLLWKNNSNLVPPKQQVKEGIQAHVSELAFQAVLRTETKQQASHYPHENVVFHAAQLQAETLSPQAPLKVNGEKTRTAQDVIFDRRHVDLFNQALQDPNHRLRRAAERAMQGFTMAADKPDGISASSASREFNAPTTFFLHWAKRYGAIPILKEGKGQGSKIILDREKAKKAAELYHEAKQQRIQPRKLLKRMSSS